MSIARTFRPDSADNLPIVISQVNGDKRFELKGSNRPKEGVRVRESLRYRKIQYPGSEKATYQVAGTTQAPVTFTGWFSSPNDILIDHTRFDADAAQIPSLDPSIPLGVIGASRARSEYLRQIFHDMGKVRVEWGQNIQLVGLIVDVSVVNYRHQKVEYEFTLDPEGPEASLISENNLRAELVRRRGEGPVQELGKGLEKALLLAQEMRTLMFSAYAVTSFAVRRSPQRGAAFEEGVQSPEFVATQYRSRERE